MFRLVKGRQRGRELECMQLSLSIFYIVVMLLLLKVTSGVQAMLACGGIHFWKK